MKNNYKSLKKYVYFLFFVFINLVASSQVTLDFRNANLISGTANQVNAKYRFQNVGTAQDGVALDCLVTITNLQHATLTQFDDNGDHIGNGNSSFDPIVQLDGSAVNGSNDGSYAEFLFEFVLHSDNSVSKAIHTNAYAMDVDGNNGGIREYVIISNFGGYILNNNTLLNYIPYGRFEAQTDVVNPGIDANERFLAKTTYTLLDKFTYRAGVLRDYGNSTTGRLFALAFESIPFSDPNEVTVIDAVDDAFSPLIQGVGGILGNVLTNDIVEGNPANAANLNSRSL